MPEVTIVVPHYRTPRLTRLCLRLLRRFTTPELARVVLVDNGSEESTRAWFRSLPWLTTLSAGQQPEDAPAQAHARALDRGLQEADTPFLLSIHTDTLVIREGWLRFLLCALEPPELAAVGSWKLEAVPLWKRTLQGLEHGARRLLGRARPPRDRYLRSHCALYRTALLRRHGLRFATGDEPAGRELHRALLAHGHRTRFLRPAELLPWLRHVNHATMALHPALGARPATIRKGLRRLRRELAAVDAEAMLADARWDR